MEGGARGLNMDHAVRHAEEVPGLDPEIASHQSTVEETVQEQQ